MPRLEHLLEFSSERSLDGQQGTVLPRLSVVCDNSENNLFKCHAQLT